MFEASTDLMNSTLCQILALMIFFYLGFGVLLFSMQRSFIYFPTEFVQHKFDEVKFENDDRKITSILLNRGKHKAILYFGGNAETVAFTAAEFEQELSSYSQYFVNYPGYAGSDGSPNEAALFSDALSLYDNLVLAHEDVFVIGRSLGSGVASYVAAERPVEKLVLITPFDSIQSLAQKQFPLYPMSLLLKDKYNSAQRAVNIHADTLILAAANDEVVGRMHTEKLITALKHNGPVVEIIEGTSHNDISQKKIYFQVLTDFLN